MSRQVKWDLGKQKPINNKGLSRSLHHSTAIRIGWTLQEADLVGGAYDARRTYSNSEFDINATNVHQVKLADSGEHNKCEAMFEKKKRGGGLLQILKHKQKESMEMFFYISGALQYVLYDTVEV